MGDQIVDACCLINLCASCKVEPIISACGGAMHVTAQVQREALSIRQPDPNDASLLVPVSIDVVAMISDGLLKDCCLEGAAETAAYVEFAAQIDDGEASCLAIAKSRGWLVATDDRKAIRLAVKSGISVITTPELIERWAKATRAPDHAVAETIRFIERFARFRPKNASPLYEWWTELSDAR